MAFAIDDLESIVAHWSADQITGLSDGDPVSSLPDSVGGWDLSAALSGRPNYRPSSVINSLPAIEFDGTDDFMTTGSTQAVSNASIRNAYVVRLPSLKNFICFGALSSSSGVPVNGAADYLTVGYETGNYLHRAATNFNTTYSCLSASNTLLIIDTMGARGLFAIVNGIAKRIQNSADPAAFVGGQKYASFGNSSLAGSLFSGLLAEWVIFDETVKCETQYIEGVLAHKYGVTLPASHPFAVSAPASGPTAVQAFSGVSNLRRLGT